MGQMDFERIFSVVSEIKQPPSKVLSLVILKSLSFNAKVRQLCQAAINEGRALVKTVFLNVKSAPWHDDKFCSLGIHLSILLFRQL